MLEEQVCEAIVCSTLKSKEELLYRKAGMKEFTKAN